MTALVITIVILGWIASALVRTADKRSREKHYAAARNRERSFDYRLREAEIETKRILAESKAETERIIALEKARIEQEKWNAKQEKINRKQAEINRKTDERLHKVEFTLAQAVSDIEFLRDRLAQLDAQRDYYMLQQSGTVPGGKEHTKWQNKIMVIDNQIHTTENKLSKAEFNKAEAERKLKEVA